MEHKRVGVVFGERDGIKIGHSLLAINGTKVRVENGKAVVENDDIDLASMFYSLYAMAVQLSPDQGSSGINELE